ncbi:hypothetical protein RAB80_014374 [Fusarium oxysporum f. sp. vasinfectum]|uniref:Integrase core domain-containing protein n=1 Tax=Fusarium oxysporum f. sp. vasinfectum 25433 TaxID=1089449 RepID=X0KY71_FUSOX|nr:hypothetical protein FOTG_17925 [Fusarium oxysporum f. sp. vasinfectum 25433]KAK2670237.1 hypothetical protein RAB80_014374 [Fusarium oxysporum f. sp. vasinfectum]
MARPPSPIDQYRDYITFLYLNGASRSKIRHKLRKRHQIAVDLSTISRRMASWGLPRQQSRTIETPELIEAIPRPYLPRWSYREADLECPSEARLAHHQKRFKTDQTSPGPPLEQVIVEMAQRSNAIAGYGRRFLQPYLRQQQQPWVPRDPLFEMYKIMFPNEVEMRKRMMRRKKGQFLVPGPNYQWCIDGHDKLKAYGFEIYAAIDAYSRNIIWFYVGHSATTALSVLKQYLAACDTYGFRPWFLQADRGSETPLVAAAHWNFALAAGGCVEWNGQVFQQGKRLKGSYKAAPSTKNVKIEGWWERMLHVCSRQWVDYFGELARDGDFDGSMLEDQVAIYAVFEGVLRQELFDFVEAWNLHKIRLQKNRPHVVHGQPWMNYHYPDSDKACNWGIPIDRPVLGEMLRPLAGIDISTCLEPETKEWCRGVLAEMGYDDVVLGNHQDPDKLRPFKRFYLALRDRIIQHIESRQPPVLAYRRAPTGGVAEYGALLARANQARQDKLEDGEPAEQPLVEFSVEDEEGNDIEEVSDDGEDGDRSDGEPE